MHMTRHWGLLSCSALALLMGAAGPALAQDQAKEPGSSDTIGEVVVTAQRREQRLRDVPSTVNVVTGDQLAASGPIQNTGDVLGKVPGVRFNNLQNPLLSEVTVRGSGSGRATGADPAVGLFANGVFIGAGGNRNFPSIDTFDLGRAEVLSGPQGALYGRNAEYGVVNLISQEPKFVNEGYVSDSYTIETKSNRLTGVVNYAFSDSLALRVAVQSITQNGGFVYNPNSDSYFDSTRGWMGRATLRYSSGPLELKLIGSFQRLDLPAYSQISYILPNTIATFPKGFFGDRYVIPVDGVNKSGDDVDSVVLQGDYDLGSVKLSSTSSYRKRSTTQMRGFTSTAIDLQTLAQQWALGNPGAYPLSGANNPGLNTTYYQDLHLSGGAFDDRLRWLAGGEGLYSKTDSETSQRADPCATAANPNIKTGQGICTGTPTAPECILLTPTSTACPTVFPSAFGFRNISHNRFKSWAAYLSLTYKLTDALTVIGDVRYTKDHKEHAGESLNLYANTPRVFTTGGSVADAPGSFSKGVATWTATVNYKFSNAGLVYAKMGTGYRAGDFNAGASPPLIGGLLGGKAPPAGYAPVIASYGDERIISYEAGVKATIARRIFATLTAYASKMDDAITTVNDGCALNNSCVTNAANYVVNAGKVEATGVEGTLDSRFDVFDGALNMQFTVANQSANYKDVPTTRVGLAAGQATGLPLEGSSVAQNPHWSSSFTVNYRHDLMAEAEGFINLSWRGQWGGLQDATTATIPAGVPLEDYQEVNLRTGVDYKNLQLALVVTNLTNQTHVMLIAAQRSTNPALDYFPTSYRYSFPRTYGVELKYKW